MNRLYTIIKTEMSLQVDLKSDTPLISSGLINSFGITKLINILEKHYPIAIDSADIGVDNFDTVEQIHQFIESKKPQQDAV